MTGSGREAAGGGGRVPFESLAEMKRIAAEERAEMVLREDLERQARKKRAALKLKPQELT